MAAALFRLDVRAGPGVSRETRELTHTPSLSRRVGRGPLLPGRSHPLRHIERAVRDRDNEILRCFMGNEWQQFTGRPTFNHTATR
jgi:hypothetical protein